MPTVTNVQVESCIFLFITVILGCIAFERQDHSTVFEYVSVLIDAIISLSWFTYKTLWRIQHLHKNPGRTTHAYGCYCILQVHFYHPSIRCWQMRINDDTGTVVLYDNALCTDDSTYTRWPLKHIIHDISGYTKISRVTNLNENQGWTRGRSKFGATKYRTTYILEFQNCEYENNER